MRRAIAGLAWAGLILVLAGPARADDQAELKTLIDKAIAAHGGKDNITKHKAATWKAKGKVEIMGGVEFTGDWYSLKDKFRFNMDMTVMGMALKITQVLNGDKGWTKVSVGGNVVQEMELTKEMVDEGKEEVYASRIQSLEAFAENKPELKVDTIGEMNVQGKPCLGVRVTSKGHRDVNLYIDKETHLVVKAEHQVKDFQEGGKEYNQEYFMSEFKDNDGVKAPSKMIVHRDGKPYLEIEMTEFKHVDSLDDSLFEKP